MKVLQRSASYFMSKFSRTTTTTGGGGPMPNANAAGGSSTFTPSPYLTSPASASAALISNAGLATTASSPPQAPAPTELKISFNPIYTGSPHSLPTPSSSPTRSGSPPWGTSTSAGAIPTRSAAVVRRREHQLPPREHSDGDVGHLAPAGTPPHTTRPLHSLTHSITH